MIHINFNQTSDNNVYPDMSQFPKKFNRVTLTYSANVAFIADMALRICPDGSESEEWFGDTVFLRPADKCTESFIISSGYCVADKISRFMLAPAESDKEEILQAAKIHIFDIAVDRVELPHNLAFIENSDYKVGADLTLGGAIVWFEDKHCTENGLKNLVNRHDTGRLIQQSYYGTSSMPYKTHIYAGRPCAYNPVQGGDQFGNKSRIVDYFNDGRKMYIKCRPLDWPQNNSPTPFYMENTYSFEGGCLRVDNVCVDFSGYDNPTRVQETPAMYTVGSLYRLAYGETSEAWSDIPIKIVEYVGSYYKGQAYNYNFQSAETWGAFINDNNYGLGIYSPSTSLLSASRSTDEKSDDDTADPNSYIGTAGIVPLVTGKEIKYSYLLASGNINDIREKFKAMKDFVKNEDIKCK